MVSSSPHISSLSIRGYRSFRDLELNNLGRINLITGKNSSGKSSLLEAIQMLAEGGGVSVIKRTLEQREELPDGDNDILGCMGRSLFRQLGSCLRAFPNFLKTHPQFSWAHREEGEWLLPFRSVFTRPVFMWTAQISFRATRQPVLKAREPSPSK